MPEGALRANKRGEGLNYSGADHISNTLARNKASTS